MNFAVQIQSYERFDMLCVVLNQIRSQRSDCPIVVVNDSSRDKRYSSLTRMYNNLRLVKTPCNGGKENYWRTVALGLRYSRRAKWDYLVFLADDVQIAPNLFDELEKHCVNNTVVNFFNTGLKSMWGFDTYVDGAFAAPRSFWEKVKFNIPQVSRARWKYNKMLGSGVWTKVTQKIHLFGYNIKMLSVSLMEHTGNHDSKMNPIERRRNPIKGGMELQKECIYNVRLGGISAKFCGELRGDLIESYWASGNFYECDVLKEFSNVKLEGDIIIDAGSHRGNHAVFFSKHTGMKVLCFEPFLENYKWLKKNVELNELRDVFLINEALGASVKDVFISNTGSNTGMAQLSDKGQPIKQVTIDSFEVLDKVAAIKIDTEGHEFNVIKGAEKTIAKDAPVMVIETDKPKEIKDLLKVITNKNYNISKSLGKTPTYIYTPQ